MESDPLVEVYHGTAEVLGERILRDDYLSPRPGNKYAYVTTDIEVAKTYARAWTAWALTDMKKTKVKPIGMILKLKIRKSLLEDDPYNPEDEPDQYRVKGGIYLEGEAEKVDLSELKDESKLLSAYCYWIGIGRATDE